MSIDLHLRVSQKFRQTVVSRATTWIWLLLHLPYVHSAPRVRVALSVKLRPTWSFSGRRLRIELGHGSRIHGGVILQGGGTIRLGKRSYLSPNCIIGSQQCVDIGDDVMIAAAVSIRDTDHNFSSLELPMNRQGATSAPVIIENDVWIGHGAVILKGVTVGTGAVIAAQALVNKDVPRRSIVGGVPARVIGTRD